MFQDELQRQNDKSDFEMSKQRRRQKELQKQIQSLEDQKRKLCSTKDGVCLHTIVVVNTCVDIDSIKYHA